MRKYHGRMKFGFRDGLGSRETLLALQVLSQNCRDVRKDVFLYFRDYDILHIKGIDKTALKTFTGTK